ncbi:MAG: ATP-binding cassette domain-containing protein, partial [Nocardioidaceae bacterium]|nr:ATP-binding cassette domain-containing protein [Nocardioidaceae bacterium]
IEEVPEIRDKVSLQSLAVSRLGKDVVDLIDVSVSFPVAAPASAAPAGRRSEASGDQRTILRDVEWRIAPGERTGILGVNGAGKSTLLGLIAGTVAPTSGKVKRGVTVKVATLTQRLDELDDVLDEPVRTVIAGLRTSYTLGSGSKAQELTPGQLLERLGFSSAQLSTPVKDLSGGQKRRLQLLLILLDEPNVLILDEPTNDLDTDMLAAIEDLLDSWPGTLLVVSHDRYLIERVTDQQFAILDTRLRHLPGGVEQYLQLRASITPDASAVTNAASATVRASGGSEPSSSGVANGSSPALSGADRRNAEKEVASIDRRLAKLQSDIQSAHDRIAEHDQSDYVGLGGLTDSLRELEGQVADLELRWLELSEQLEG